MRERIKLIMKEKGLRPSSFADKTGLSRPTISQILGENGRKNDPSKSTIDKILKAFPDISPTWFYSGEGQMLNRERPLIKQAPSSLQTDLFDGKQSVIDRSEKEKPKSQETPPKVEAKEPEMKPSNPSETIPDLNISVNISKKIDKIIIYFSDKTFLSFISENK